MRPWRLRMVLEPICLAGQGSLPRVCSLFVLDISCKLGYIVGQFCSTRGALARRRKLWEQSTVSCKGSQPL